MTQMMTRPTQVGRYEVIGTARLHTDASANVVDLPRWFHDRVLADLPPDRLTFFVAEAEGMAGYVTLLTDGTDERHEGMWHVPDAPDHFGWNIRRDQVDMIALATDGMDLHLQRQAELDRANARIEEIEAELARVTDLAQQRQAEINQAVARHEADIRTLGRRLIEEAENRSWCETYDHVIRDINDDLHVPLPVREREYAVTIRVTYEVTNYVTAANEDDASESAEENFDFDDLRDREGNVEVTYVRENN